MRRRSLTITLCLLAISLSVQAPRASAGSAVDICSALNLPAQLPAAPPSIKPSNESIRVLAFGDFGDGGPDQMKVAKAMVAYDKDSKHPFDFGITLGDNFYPSGLNSSTNPRWKTRWENPYGPMEIRIYASLGNHDYYDAKSPAAEALYSKSSSTWCLPATYYYTYTAGPVQFFALDTDVIMRASQPGQNRAPLEAQKKWLQEQLDASTSPWKVVYGHHPVYSIGQHQSNLPMITEILPILKQRANVYIAGHDHDLQYLKPEEDVHFFVAGAAGHDKRPLGADPQKRRVWARGNVLGFSVLEADAATLAVSFFNDRNKRLCKVTLAKGMPTATSCL